MPPNGGTPGSSHQHLELALTQRPVRRVLPGARVTAQGLAEPRRRRSDGSIGPGSVRDIVEQREGDRRRRSISWESAKANPEEDRSLALWTNARTLHARCPARRLAAVVAAVATASAQTPGTSEGAVLTEWFRHLSTSSREGGWPPSLLRGQLSGEYHLSTCGRQLQSV